MGLSIRGYALVGMRAGRGRVIETPACLERLVWSAENAEPKAQSELENTRLAKIRPIRLDLSAIWNRWTLVSSPLLSGMPPKAVMGCFKISHFKHCA